MLSHSPIEALIRGLALPSLALFLLLGAATLPRGALAQYMYLDSNGDGVHTEADVVNPTGGTTIDVYLVTDQGADGFPDVCPYEDGILNINSYSVGLRASGGTITWGTPINRIPEFGVNFGFGTNETELFYGKGGGTKFPPGIYHLMTIVASTASGAPDLQIVPEVEAGPFSFRITSFGSNCPGVNGNNTYTLGLDWFDVGGLAAGTGGVPNTGPTLAMIQDMTLAAGDHSVQEVTASDPDNQLLELSAPESPSYMAFTSASQVPGAATGRIYLHPLRSDIGSTVARVQVSDGETAASRSFGITVTIGPDHPSELEPVGPLAVTCGRVLKEPIYARDPDGEVLSFSKTSGPSFLDVRTLAHGPVVAHGLLTLSPSICDAGTHDASITVGSGSVSDQSSLRINVELPVAISGDLGRNIPVPSAPVDVALADFNRDGNMDIAAVTRDAGFNSVLLGDGNGTFGTRYDVPQIGHAIRVLTGDWNQDGAPDLGTIDFSDGKLSIWFGRGDGTFSVGPVLATGGLPQDCLTADLNNDGLLDIVVASSSGAFVSVFMGNGAGAFAPRVDTATPASAVCVAISDLNRDGRLDLVAGMLGPRIVSVHLGNGDGTFQKWTEFTIPAHPMSISPADLNADGATDLVVSDYDGAMVAVLGDGAGRLTPRGAIAVFPEASSPKAAVSDLNGDGYLDVALVRSGASGVSVFYGNGTGEFLNREDIPAAGGLRVALGDLNGDAIPDFVLPGALRPPFVLVQLNTMGAGTAVEARAFLKDSNRPRPGAAGNNPMCARIEPLNSSYMNADVNYSSLALKSNGTGSVSSIAATQPKNVSEGDTDGNNIAEIPACFAGADVARLFDQVSGRRTVHVNLEGALKDGRRFCSGFDMTVVGTGGPLAARVTPNPLNPSGVLAFRTSRDGYVRVRMFDLNGRLVRTLADIPLAVAGDQEVRIDGRGARGETLATGAYFYVIETPEGKTRGRIMILK